MADNFNMKKFLTENKLSPYAKLKEEEEKSNVQKLIDGGYDEENAKEYADAFENGREGEIPEEAEDILNGRLPLDARIEIYIDNVIKQAKNDGEFEYLKSADWFHNELLDNILEKFDTKDDYDSVSQGIKDYIDLVIGGRMSEIEEIDNAIYASLDDPDPDRRGDAERTGAEYIKLSDPRNPQHREWMRSKSSSSTKSSPLDKIVSRLRMIYRHRIDAFQYKPAQRQSAIETLVKAVEDELAKSTIQNKEGAKFVILKKLLGHVPFDYKKFLPSQTPTRQLTGDPEVDYLGERLSFQVMDRIEGLINEKMLQTALMALDEVIADLKNEGIEYDDALAYVKLAVKEKFGEF